MIAHLQRQRIDGRRLDEDHWVVTEIVALYTSLKDGNALHFGNLARAIDERLTELRARAAAGGEPF